MILRILKKMIFLKIWAFLTLVFFCILKFKKTLLLEVVVLLLREWIQEIKRMMMMHSTHSLFLTCTQGSRLYLHNVQLINIYTMYRQSLIESLAEIIKIHDLLSGPVSCSWWRIPIQSGPLPGSNCPTLWLLHLSPLSHTLSPHYTIYNDDIYNHSLLCPGQ
jgi:hypothetical protein